MSSNQIIHISILTRENGIGAAIKVQLVNVFTKDKCKINCAGLIKMSAKYIIKNLLFKSNDVTIINETHKLGDADKQKKYILCFGMYF